METVGIFATQEKSKWVQDMVKAARYPGAEWADKALGILDRGEVDFDGTPTGWEIVRELEALIGSPPKRERQRFVYWAKREGILEATGTRRRDEEARAPFPEYHVYVGRNELCDLDCGTEARKSR